MKIIYGVLTLLVWGLCDLTASMSSKIDGSLTESLQRNGHADILVSMKDGTQDILDSISSKSFSSRTERSQAVYDTLTSHARKSQSKILRSLSTQLISEKFRFGNVKSLWITNQISIELASGEFINHLAAMVEISRIQEDEIVQLHRPIENQVSNDPPAITVNQWGIVKIQAPDAWSLYNVGVNITVANIDTGVRGTHEILRSNYKNDGHSWYDPVRRTQIPTDDNGHGTHTMGTIVGQNGYGVAPLALWIACKALNSAGSGTAGNLLTCGQYVVCPWATNGQNADCSKTPHIVSNSWGMSVGGSTSFDSMIAAWHAAGIIPVFSIGNDGTACGTVRSPGDRDVIGVGATTNTDAISYFSSVGPGSGGFSLKPEISAPGSSIVSASYQSDTAYRTMSGTSMAGPHVAGSVALLLNQNETLTYAQVRSYILNSADQNLISSNAICGGVRDNTFPNYHFGYGRINIFSALKALLGI